MIEERGQEGASYPREAPAGVLAQDRVDLGLEAEVWGRRGLVGKWGKEGVRGRWEHSAEGRAEVGMELALPDCVDRKSTRLNSSH